MVESIDSGAIDPEFIVFSDETWLAADRNHANFQNDRKYFDGDVKKDEVMGELLHEQKQRSPGLMFHMAVCAADGGIAIAPHFVPEKTSVDSKYYCGLLEGTTLPRVRLAMNGRAWWWQQDGASPHTAKATTNFLRDNGVPLLHSKWPATSACLNPLDYFVWSKVKNELYLSQKYPVDTTAELQTSALKVMQLFETDPEWKAQLRTACLSFRYRCEQIAANGGKLIVKKRGKKERANA